MKALQGLLRFARYTAWAPTHLELRFDCVTCVLKSSHNLMSLYSILHRTALGTTRPPQQSIGIVGTIERLSFLNSLLCERALQK